MSEFIKLKSGVNKEIVKEYGVSELGGTLIPSATRLGGSMGFSVEDRLDPVVDPEIRDGAATGLSRVRLEDDSVNRPVPEQEETSPAVVEQPAATPKESEVSPPAKRVCFDFGAPVGKIEAWYHSVFREGLLLVLVWDSRYKGGVKYSPADTAGKPIKLSIDREEMLVESLGVRFSLQEQHLEITVLVIVGDQE